MGDEVLETLNREFIKRVMTKMLTRMKDELNSEERMRLVNDLDEYGGSLLHYVTALDYYEMIPLLHEYGADLNIKSSNNMTSLVIAAAKGHEKSVKKLIRLGAVFWNDGENDLWEDDILNNERDRGSDYDDSYDESESDDRFNFDDSKSASIPRSLMS
jgi:ankyrin repeat protein